jgi:hypothetical protein
MVTSTTAPVEQIVMDVTGWSEANRAKLLTAIKEVRKGMATTIPAADDADHGWTKDALTALLSRLAVGRGHVVAKAFTAAIDNGGEVSRDEVYEIGEYEPTRSLKGFTRPVNRIAQNMRDQGEIAEDAIDPFTPIYDPKIKSYQQASGFRVPPEIVKLYSE